MPLEQTKCPPVRVSAAKNVSWLFIIALIDEGARLSTTVRALLKDNVPLCLLPQRSVKLYHY